MQCFSVKHCHLFDSKNTLYFYFITTILNLLCHSLFTRYFTALEIYVHFIVSFFFSFFPLEFICLTFASLCEQNEDVLTPHDG